MDVRAMTQEQALASLKKIMQGWWDSKFESRKSELASDWDKGKLEKMNFSITSGKGIFFGTCLNCRKKGHHATEYRSAKETRVDAATGYGAAASFGRSTGTLKCWHCDGPHRNTDCPNLQEGGDAAIGDINGMCLGTVMEIDSDTSLACIVRNAGDSYMSNG